MSWIQLISASLSEIIWVTLLKQTNGFTKLFPSVVVIIFATLSFYLLSLSVRSIPVGIAYAVWTGIATLGVVTVAMIIQGESANLFRLVCIALILIGVIGLRMTTLSLDSNSPKVCVKE